MTTYKEERDNMQLPDTQVYEVKRTEDLALIGVMYTRKEANELKDDYEAMYDEECYVAPSWILDKPQTIGERDANDKV